MDEQQLQQQIVQLVQAAMQGDKQATQQIQQIMQAAQQGDQQAAQLAQMIQEVAQQMQQQQVQAAKFGAKLNYIQHLKGVCPEGYEMQLFKQGGQICRKCIKKAMMEDGGKTSQNPVDAFKCGRKMKKKARRGTMTKVEKHLFGGKQRRPFTGFEGLSYQYEAANPSIQSRASRPADEWITNNGKMIIGRETWYDPESNQPEDVGYYYPGYSAERDWEAPNEQTLQTRTFNSLKRHALMNQRLREPKFACGGSVERKQPGGNLPTAQSAKERYRGASIRGSVLNYSTPDYSDITTRIVQPGFITTPDWEIGETITQVKPFAPDTTYYETPRSLFVKTKGRSASSKGHVFREREYPQGRQEYETLKRRFNEAKSAAKKK